MSRLLIGKLHVFTYKHCIKFIEFLYSIFEYVNDLLAGTCSLSSLRVDCFQNNFMVNYFLLYGIIFYNNICFYGLLCFIVLTRTAPNEMLFKSALFLRIFIVRSSKIFTFIWRVFSVLGFVFFFSNVLDHERR